MENKCTTLGDILFCFNNRKSAVTLLVFGAAVTFKLICIERIIRDTYCYWEYKIEFFSVDEKKKYSI